MSETESHALYRFFDAEDRLLYTGITKDLATRWRDHNKRKPDWRQVTRATIKHFDTREDAERAEVEAIESERPLWNVKHQPVGILPAPVAAPTPLGSSGELTPAEVASELKVSAATVRRWEARLFLIPSRRLPGSGHRRYSRAAVNELKQKISIEEDHPLVVAH